MRNDCMHVNQPAKRASEKFYSFCKNSSYIISNYWNLSIKASKGHNKNWRRRFGTEVKFSAASCYRQIIQLKWFPPFKAVLNFPKANYSHVSVQRRHFTCENAPSVTDGYRRKHIILLAELYPRQSLKSVLSLSISQNQVCCVRWCFYFSLQFWRSRETVSEVIAKRFPSTCTKMPYKTQSLLAMYFTILSR